MLTSKGRSRLRVAAAIVAGLALLWIGACGALFQVMRQPPEAFGKVMAKLPFPVFLVLPFETLWTQARAGTLHLGDAAPDFDLAKLDRSDKIRLSTLLAKQPVVLVFGSYT